jgi:hypothetical protein
MPLNRDHDYTTRAGAEGLAMAIRGYWRKRGRVVRVHVTQDLTFRNGRDGAWVVRSDMTGGWP